MPDIKLGSSENMKNINIGSKEIQAVYKGSVVVWLNNLAPEIVLTQPPTGTFGDSDFPINVVGTTTTTIIFTAKDLDSGDKVASYSVTGPSGFTPVPTTPISPPTNPATGLSFTIPNTLFKVIGPITTNNVFTITVADQKGRDDDYTVTVENVTVEGPTAHVVTPFPNLYSYNGTSFTKYATFSMTQSPSALQANYSPEYSDDRGATWKTYQGHVVLSATATCGNHVTRFIQSRSVRSGNPTSYGSSANSSLIVSTPRPNPQGSVQGLPGGLIGHQISEGSVSDNCDGEVLNYYLQSKNSGAISSNRLPNIPWNYWGHNPNATAYMDMPGGFGRVYATQMYYYRQTMSARVYKFFYPQIMDPFFLPSTIPTLVFSGISWGTASVSQSTTSNTITQGTPSISTTVIPNFPVPIERVTSLGGNIGTYNGTTPSQSFNGSTNTITWNTSNWLPGVYTYDLAVMFGWVSNGAGYGNATYVTNRTITTTVLAP
tara:strand:- start:49 stop:1512 length:1464 start_codon:yes stop_codon:yes gene_type:complete